MIVAIYELGSGLIKRRVTTVPDHVALQIHEGEEFYLNCPEDATHITDNAPVTIAPPPPTRDELLVGIRSKRAALLAACDWTQITDSPLDTDQRAAWATYRQALRDFPATCDPANPVWPDNPEVINV